MKKSNRAFSLAELIVVTAIISVLAGLLLPMGSKLYTAHLRNKSLSNIRQLGMANIMYSGENDGGLPPAMTAVTSGVSGQPFWLDYILPYLGYQPDYAQKRRSLGLAACPLSSPPVFYNPLVSKHYPWCDFGVNRSVYYNTGTAGVSFKLARIENPHTVMLMDAGTPNATYEGGWQISVAEFTKASESTAPPRRDNKLSVYYFDGSAEVITKQYLIDKGSTLAGKNYGQDQ